MSLQNQERPYGVNGALARAMRWAIPVTTLLVTTLLIWQTRQIYHYSEEIRSINEWRATVKSTMQTEKEKLRLEILATVNGTVGVQLADIQKSMIRMEVTLDELRNRIARDHDGAGGNRDREPNVNVGTVK